MAKLIVETADVDRFEFVKDKQDSSKPTTYILKGIYAQSEQQNGNGRRYPYELLKSEIDRFDREMIQTGRALGELEHPSCFSTPDFDVLTDKGWKHFIDLKIGDLVWTRNNDKIAVLQPILDIIDQPYKGDTYTLIGKNIEAEYTAKHRIMLEDRNKNTEYVYVEDLYNNRKHYSHHCIPKTLDVRCQDDCRTFTFKACPRLYNQNQTGISTDEDLQIDRTVFCKLLGIWLAEGSSFKYDTKQNGERCNGISICQSNIANADKCKIINDFWENELPKNIVKKHTIKDNGLETWTIIDLRIGNFFQQLGDIYTKHLPEEVFSFSKEDLQTLLYWFALGDRRKSTHFRKYGNLLIDNVHDMFSTSKKLIDDLSYIQLLAGIASTNRTIISKTDYIYGGHLIEAKNKKPLFFNNVIAADNTSADYRTLKIIKHENVEAGSYCIRVENGNFFARYNGKSYWTGNCPEIRPQESAIRILSIKEDNKCWIGESCILASQPEFGIRGTPKGDILLSLVQYGTKVGFSTRALGEVDDDGVVSDVKLCTIDCVANPSIGQFCESNGDRFVNGILESKEFVITQHGDIYEAKYNTFENKLKKMPNTYISSKKAAHIGSAFHDFFESLVDC